MSLLTRTSPDELPHDATGGRRHPPSRVPGPLDRVTPDIGAVVGAGRHALTGHAAARRAA